MENKDNFICDKCIHKFKWKLGCEAFPEGIVDLILMTNNHDKPLDNQDNDVVFEKVED